MEPRTYLDEGPDMSRDNVARWARRQSMGELRWQVENLRSLREAMAECMAEGIEPRTSLGWIDGAIETVQAEMQRRRKRNVKERERRSAYADAARSVGMRRVRGNLGGRYWE